ESQVSPQVMGIVVCLLVSSVWSFKTEREVMCERFYQLQDFASQHPEAEAIFYLID
ncbi:antirestriction protein, partial [Vibrio cholerae]